MSQQIAPRPILVAVDFSRESESALLVAAGLADTTWPPPLIILHVAHEPTHKPGFYDRRGQSDSILPIAYLARRMLTEFMTQMRRQYPEIARLQNVQEEIVSGLPETRIPELAKKIDAQLIILGSANRSTLSKLCFGSVSNKVKRRSDIPVRVVRPNGAGGEDTQQVEDSDILCERPRSTGGLRNRLGLG
jgi:nucleotide-binding universal stress UspA family protein